MSEMELLSPLETTILAFLAKIGEPIDRATMSEYLEVPRTTLFDNIERLILNNHVKKIKHRLNQRGRPMIYYSLTD